MGTVFAARGVKRLGICKGGGAGTYFRCDAEAELLLGRLEQGGCAWWRWFGG